MMTKLRLSNRLVACALGACFSACAPDNVTSVVSGYERTRFLLTPSGSTLVQDTFTDPDGTNIVSHVAETGQSWTLDGGFTNKIKIEGNTAQLASGADGNNWRIAIASDVADDHFEISTDYTRGSLDVNGDYAQLEFLAGSGSNPPADRVYVALTRASATSVQVRLLRTQGFSFAQSIILNSSFSLATGGSIRIGATITGLSVQVWSEPAGGGARTNIGNAVTLTSDYRDGAHKRVAFNFVGAQAFGAGSPRIDNFTVTTVPATLVQDSFTDADGTNIVAHVAETGQSWSLSGGFTDKVKVEGNTAQLASGADQNNWRIAISSDVADDHFEILTDYTRGSADVVGDYAQLEFLAGSGANPPADRVYVSLERVNGSTVLVRLVRTHSNSVAQTVVLDSAFALATSGSTRIGATVTGLSAQVWSEPSGGGTRTNIGSPVTLTADYRDGSHRRVAFNFVGAQAFGAGSPRIDNFTVSAL
jgi:hypothetical protein